MTADLIWIWPGLLMVFFSVALWTALCWPAARAISSGDEEDGISVLIPARNEEGNIGNCLRSVMSQDGTVREIIVLDDNSTDGTARIVRHLAAEDGRIKLMDGRALADGWSGKCWACSQLAESTTSNWMLFLDADTKLTDNAASRILASARHFNCTMLSCWPGMDMLGFWERLLMPMLNFLTFTMYPAPLAYIRESDASLGLAHGACILLRRAEYMSTGGHGAVKDQLFEDTRLARHWREQGLRSCCIDGSRLIRVRMYDSLAAIFLGFEKNFYSAFGNSLGFFAFLLLHLGLFLLPFILLGVALAGVGPDRLLAFSVVSSVIVLATRLVLSLRFGHPLWSILLHPIAELLLLAIALNSWGRTVTGRGVRWKGRTYHSAADKSRQGAG